MHAAVPPQLVHCAGAVMVIRNIFFSAVGRHDVDDIGGTVSSSLNQSDAVRAFGDLAGLGVAEPDPIPDAQGPGGRSDERV